MRAALLLLVWSGAADALEPCADGTYWLHSALARQRQPQTALRHQSAQTSRQEIPLDPGRSKRARWAASSPLRRCGASSPSCCAALKFTGG
jgi:hypothetical protein